jgi:hypothetical protein
MTQKRRWTRPPEHVGHNPLDTSVTTQKSEDGRGQPRSTEDGRGRRRTAEVDGGRPRSTEDCRGRPRTGGAHGPLQSGGSYRGHVEDV